MKYSKYNFIIRDSQVNYLWNTYSNAVSSLDKDAFVYLSKLEPNSKLDNNTPFIEHMKRNGFAVNDDVDETAIVMDGYRNAIEDTTPEMLSITLAPSMSCNYNCLYCFETGKRSNSKMSETTAGAVVRFISNKISNNSHLKSVVINGFGGEPLMNVDILEFIYKPIIKLCDARAVKFKGHIITNGYYLTEDIADRLANCKINSAQVSIDGMPHIYSVNKGTTPSAFYKVVDNIAAVCHKIKISVRINVPRNGLASALELSDYLLKKRNLDGKISVYIANIRLYDASVLEEQENFINWCKMDHNFLEKFKPDGGIYNPHSLSLRSITSHKAPCQNICRYNACIGSEGELYPCEHYFGNKQYICGSVFSGSKDTVISEKFRKAQLSEKKCMSCTFLPICMGGCPDDNINSRNIIDCEEYCKHLAERKLFEIKLKTQWMTLNK